MDPILRLSALEQAALVREGELSSEELLRRHIARIEECNPKLNAVVATRFEFAIDEARAIDRLPVAEKTNRALCGVPFTVKECIAVEGMPHTAGSFRYKGQIADRDAVSVAHLRRQGAIPLGVTNLPELAFGVESYNVIYGRTNNPYDLKRTCGGSSGGEAAIIAAGGVPFGVGSDIGGSIRMPSMFCGIFGHKPSSGLVSLTGNLPNLAGKLREYCVIGPLARRAKDLLPLLNIMSDENRAALRPVSRPESAPPVSFRGQRIYLCPSFEGLTPSPTKDVAFALEKAARVLRSYGAIVEPWSDPRLAHALSIWISMLGAETENPGLASLIGHDQETYPLLREFVLSLVGKSHNTSDVLFCAAFERVHYRFTRRIRHYAEQGKQLRHVLQHLLGNEALLLAPIYPRVAPRHLHTRLRPADWIYSSLFNVLELPATAVPCGLTADGLPVGIQIVGGYNNDERCISAAILLEEALGGWIPSTL